MNTRKGEDEMMREVFSMCTKVFVGFRLKQADGQKTQLYTNQEVQWEQHTLGSAGCRCVRSNITALTY